MFFFILIGFFGLNFVGIILFAFVNDMMELSWGPGGGSVTYSIVLPSRKPQLPPHSKICNHVDRSFWIGCLPPDEEEEEGKI